MIAQEGLRVTSKNNFYSKKSEIYENPENLGN